MDAKAILLARRETLIKEIQTLERELEAFEGLEDEDENLQRIERAYFEPQSPIEEVRAICLLIASDGRVFQNKEIIARSEHKHVHVLLKRLALSGLLEKVAHGKWRCIGDR